jgi:hypothetical protein
LKRIEVKEGEETRLNELEIKELDADAQVVILYS